MSARLSAHRYPLFTPQLGISGENAQERGAGTASTVSLHPLTSHVGAAPPDADLLVAVTLKLPRPDRVRADREAQMGRRPADGIPHLGMEVDS